MRCSERNEAEFGDLVILETENRSHPNPASKEIEEDCTIDCGGDCALDCGGDCALDRS